MAGNCQHLGAHVVRDYRGHCAVLEKFRRPKFVLVNGHGGNYALGDVRQEANVSGKRKTPFPTGEYWRAARSAAHLESSMHEDMHAFT
jgi:creatinine amidohydrolase/Fe(II)-dependent formamide hydrolase-like protein